MSPHKNQNRKNRKDRSAHRNMAAALLVFFCFCVGGIAMVSAKYIRQTTTKKNAVTAKEFYFESDLLDGKEHEIIPTENQGTTASVTIRLKNHVDALRYSDTAIAYTLSVRESGSDSSATDVTITNGSGTIATGSVQDADVKLEGLQKGKTYVVTATTNEVYAKTLTGILKIAEPDANVYASIHNENQYIEVIVWTTDYAGTVSLQYADSLIPDNTDSKMQTTFTTNEKKITDTTWESNTSHVYRFFKSDTTKRYKVSVNDKEVTVSEQ